MRQPGVAEPASLMRMALGVALALAGMALAYVLWWISDRLLYIGPWDRAAFGWIFVMPIAFIAPCLAGLAWWSARPSQWRAGALVIGLPLAVFAAFALAPGVHQIHCEPVSSWTQVLPRTAAVGLAIGAGWGGAAYAAAWAASASHGWWRYPAAIGAGGGISFVSIWIALGVFATVFPPVLCAPHT